jgi:hypothetical protein
MLYSSVDDNGASIGVWQPATGELFLFRVKRTQALEAFYHPFAHLPPAEDGQPASAASSRSRLDVGHRVLRS